MCPCSVSKTKCSYHRSCVHVSRWSSLHECIFACWRVAPCILSCFAASRRQCVSTPSLESTAAGVGRLARAFAVVGAADSHGVKMPPYCLHGHINPVGQQLGDPPAAVEW